MSAPHAITRTFHHWEASLSEYLDRRLALAYMSELFSAYCMGATPAQAAEMVREIDGRPDL
jgi:hypothetical protein